MIAAAVALALIAIVAWRWTLTIETVLVTLGVWEDLGE